MPAGRTKEGGLYSAFSQALRRPVAVKAHFKQKRGAVKFYLNFFGKIVKISLEKALFRRLFRKDEPPKGVCRCRGPVMVSGYEDGWDDVQPGSVSKQTVVRRYGKESFQGRYEEPDLLTDSESADRKSKPLDCAPSIRQEKVEV